MNVFVDYIYNKTFEIFFMFQGVAENRTSLNVLMLCLCINIVVSCIY